jgi:hypothetical protein
MKKDNAISTVVLLPSSKLNGELNKQMFHAVKAASLVADETEARERVSAQASALFEHTHGSIAASELDVNEAQKAVDKLDKKIKETEDELNKLEPSYVSTSTDKPKGKFSASRFDGWNTLDKGLAYVLIVIIPVMMGIATVNLQSIIENSFIPVFIASPWKGWLISLIAPASALALDMLPKFFSPKIKKRYTQGLVIVTAIVTIAWIALFSVTFDGFSVAVQSTANDLYAEVPTGQDTRLYSFIQLLAEILISSSLVAALQALFERYQPLKEVPHPMLASLKERLAQLLSERIEAMAHLSRETMRHNTLLLARQAFINHWLDELTITRARYAATSQFFEEK